VFVCLYPASFDGILIISGLDVLVNVLTPRSKAMFLCCDRLRNRTDAIYDVTIAYGDTLDPSTKQRIPAPGLVGNLVYFLLVF